MKVIIIEDEAFAAKRLENLIREYDPAIEIVAQLESVSESILWLKAHTDLDLIFLDIHLEDGISFSIFESVTVNTPIIFTTAYDEYAIKAFKLRSIDYLLKPIGQEELNQAMNKFREWNGNTTQSDDIKALFQLMKNQHSSHRERFSVAVGQRLKSIEVSDISYFFSTAGITFAMMKTKNQYALDSSLDALEEELDPKYFFRINRQLIVSHASISNVHIYPKSRLKLDLNPVTTEDVFVSVYKTASFRKWLDGKM